MSSEPAYDSSSEASSEEDLSNIFTVLPSSRNFLDEVNKCLAISQSSNNIDANEAALILNREMQNMLQEMKSKLELLLRKCKAKYKHNDEVLQSLPSSKKEITKPFYRSYNFCGIPFFKTNEYFVQPPNNDYIIRKKKNKELFPADLLFNRPTYWTTKDKASIIHGVKQQLIAHLCSKRRNEPSTSSIRDLTDREYLSTKYLSNLLSECDKDFKICWYRISSEFIKHRFNESSCEAMWNMYLKPGINRSHWSEDENKKLIKVASMHNFQNWASISEAVENRSEFQCFAHYYAVLNQPGRKEKKWTPENDEKLLKIVKKCSMNNIIRWNLVKQHYPNLSKNQLHHRYQYSINPTINRSKFTKEEDCVILAAIEKYGENFQAFPLGLFPGRTIVQIRNRWHNTLKYIGKHSFWTLEEDEKLIQLIEEHGVGNWSTIASKLTNKTRSSTRQRHLTIKKFLEKNPQFSLKECPRKHKPLGTSISLEKWQDEIVFKDKAKIEAERKEETLREARKYYNSLRCLEKEYYQFFKFSYDYSFNTEFVSIYNPLSNLNLLVNLLQVKIDKNSLSKFHYKFNTAEYSLLKKLSDIKIEQNSIEEKNNIPPNWSTLLGFRGVCLQCASTIHTVPKQKQIYKAKETGKSKIAKELFRKRFHMLFYKTALLSRLENCFIPHEILLSNSNILENFSLNNISNQQETIESNRISPPVYEEIPTKQFKSEN